MSISFSSFANGRSGPAEPSSRPTLLMADFALKMSIMGLVAPGLWFLICVNHGWAATATPGWIGYVISAAIPFSLTLVISWVAMRQLHEIEGPIAGAAKVRIAVFLGVLSPMIWLLINLLVHSGGPR